MFGEGFLSDHLFDILGLLVTIGGIWLVVRQLREAKLASQMEGLLKLQEGWGNLINHRNQIMELAVQNNEWDSLSPKEAYKSIFKDRRESEGFLEIGNFLDTIGLLVRSGALDKDLAYRGYGYILTLLFFKLEKVIFFDRKAQADPSIYENWEWIAKEFKNYSR